MKKLFIMTISAMAFILAGTCMTTCAADTDPYAPLVSKWSAPTVNPPANEHPRVYFRQSDIERIKENAESDENAYAKKLLELYASSVLTADTTYSAAVVSKIESMAFYYAIYKDAEIGRAAADGIEIIAAMDPTAKNDVCRLYGRMVNVLAELYDWCYDLLGNEEKERIIKLCIDYGEYMEMGWPLSKQGAVTGHGSEAQLLRDYLSFAIAVYDERPDIWNYHGGRFYAEFAPVRAFTAKEQYFHQGTNYGICREAHTVYAYALIVGMGAPEPYPISDLAGTAMTTLYMRRPDGQLFDDGDIYSTRTAPFGYVNPGSADWQLITAAKANNGYLKSEYLRIIQKKSGTSIVQNYTDSSPVKHLIYNDPNLKAKSFDDLPQAKYMGTPYGIMTARTSWNEGANANTAAVFMKIGEYMFNNHQHLDSGSFQIYYKGLLASESGIYDIYGTDEHYMYTTKSIAHNCMLVYDPAEALRDSNGEILNKRYNINDGGQRAVNNYNEVSLLENVTDKPGLKHAEISAHEIDPKNTQKPDYTYLKGDLTDSYTDKVSKYTRSFMYFDLKNDQIPAALVVYDYVKSSDKTYKKTWLLHSLQRPSVSCDSAVFENKLSNGDGSYSGKMQLKTLLPKAENLNTEVFGGEDEGFGVVNQYKYEDNQWKITESKNYAVNNKEGTESNAYRLEISPKTAAEEDCFLNIITVGSEGKDISVPAELIESTDGKFVGTQFCGRAVFFAKNTTDNTAFEAELAQGEYKYTVCDMKKGKYTVSAGGDVQTVYASEDGGVLAFEAGGGKVKIEYKDDDYIAPTDAEYKKSNNVLFVRKNASFIAQAVTDGDEDNPSAELSAFANVLGYDVQKTNNTYVIKKDGERISEVTAGKTSVMTKRGVYTLSAAPQLKDDGLYIKLKDLGELLLFKCEYVPFARTLYLDSYTTDDISVTAYGDENGVCVSVDTGSGYKSRPFCAVYDKKDNLIAACEMTQSGDGRYTALLKDGGKAEKVKFFPWADYMMPFDKPKTYSAYTADVSRIMRSADNSFYYVKGVAGATISRGDDDVYTVTKTDAERKESAVYGNVDKFTLGDKKSFLFSASIRVKQKSSPSEYVQIRLRGYADTLTSTFKAVNLPSEVGSECRVAVMADIENRIAKFYINGVLADTKSLADWVNKDEEPGTVNGINFYFVSSDGTGGEFEIWDSNVVIFDRGAIDDADKLVKEGFFKTEID